MDRATWIGVSTSIIIGLNQIHKLKSLAAHTDQEPKCAAIGVVLEISSHQVVDRRHVATRTLFLGLTCIPIRLFLTLSLRLDGRLRSHVQCMIIQELSDERLSTCHDLGLERCASDYQRS